MLFFAIKCSIRPNKVVSKDVGGKKKKKTARALELELIH